MLHWLKSYKKLTGLEQKLRGNPMKSGNTWLLVEWKLQGYKAEVNEESGDNWAQWNWVQLRSRKLKEEITDSTEENAEELTQMQTQG